MGIAPTWHSKGAAMTEAEEEAIFQHVLKLRAESTKKTAGDEHAEFAVIDDARWKATRAIDALAGIAALLQPHSTAGNEQLNMARRADAAAVFDLFAEVLRTQMEAIESATFHLQQDLRTIKP